MRGCDCPNPRLGSLTVDMNCPSSYIGTDGNTYYYTQAQIDACNQGDVSSSGATYGDPSGTPNGSYLWSILGGGPFGFNFPWWILMMAAGAFVVAESINNELD